jgi:hypothetical protein
MLENKNISPALTGTTMMTAFSYLVSEAHNKNFIEPELLGEMIKKLPVKMKDSTARTAGWAMHYGIGFAWAPILYGLLKKMPASNALTASLALGAISGITAVLVWKAAFSMHPAAPDTDYKRFYRQLVIAHWVFCLPFVVRNKSRR